MQQFRNLLPGLWKDHLNITQNGGLQWYVIFWASCFHQALEATILHNLKWLNTFSDPSDDLHSIVFEVK